MRERGLKLMMMAFLVIRNGRSREGAWIEISAKELKLMDLKVAPVRERGLKYRTWLDYWPRQWSLP